MNIYESEKHIARLIENNKATCESKIILDSSVNLNKMLSEASINPCTESCKAAIENTTDDVMPFSSLLVTDLWNRNDDVFTTREIVQSYNTAKYKPINWMHRGSEDRENETIGVMINSDLITGSVTELRPLTEDIGEQFLQDKTSGNVHIKQDGLIWSAYFPSYAASIERGIENRDLYVSMECFFDDFGYAMRENENSEKTLFLERNPSNSYMSDKLRAYGGSGKVRYNGKEYQIGRWLRDVVFSGQGIVDDPANRSGSEILSVIFANGEDVMQSSVLEATNSVKNEIIGYKEVEEKEVIDMSNFEEKYNQTLEENTKLQTELNSIKEAAVHAGQQEQQEALASALRQSSSYKKDLVEAKAAIVDATTVIGGFSEVIEERSYYKGYAEKAESIFGEMRSQEKAYSRVQEMSQLVGENVYGSPGDIEELKNMDDVVYNELKKAISKVSANVLGDDSVNEETPKKSKPCLPCEAKAKKAKADREAKAKQEAFKQEYRNNPDSALEALKSLQHASVAMGETVNIVPTSFRDPLSDAKNLIKNVLRKK